MTEPKDPTIDPSYRAAVRRAKEIGIILTPIYIQHKWTVHAEYRPDLDGRHEGFVDASGMTAAFAAWCALEELVTRG